jgi:tetratricopeptide (TPR) repeat protein
VISTVNTNRIATLQDSKGRLHEVTDFPYVIGRDKEVNLSLPGNSVSRRHAKIEFENGRYLLIDMASTNGTRVNKKKITQMYLEHQDALMFGDERLTFALMHPAHAKVIATARLRENDLEVKRQTPASLNFDDDQTSSEIGTEDRNWFIWIVALVILLVMLGSAYLIFQIRGGNLAQTMDFSWGTIESENQSPTQNDDHHEIADQQEIYDQPADVELELADEGIEQQTTMESELNKDIKSSSVDSQDHTEIEPPLIENDGWPELVTTSAPENKNFEASSTPKSTSAPKKVAPEIEMEIISPRNPPVTENYASFEKGKTENESVVAVEDSKKKNTKPTVKPEGSSVSSVEAKNDLPDPIKLYLEGDAQLALKAIDQKMLVSENAKQNAALKQQRQSIQNLYQQYELGQKAMQNGDKKAAFQEWLSFLNKESDFLSGMKKPKGIERSRYALGIAKAVGAEYFSLGNAAKANRNFADAYRYWMLAAKFDDVPKALANANTIEQYAIKIYEQAETLELQNPQEANRLWRQVLTILPKDHELCMKAQAKLARSQR